jgi:hypothetical protein
MRGRDFLEVVRFLETLDTEAGLRAQIGRLYYAAYLELAAGARSISDSSANASDANTPR